MIFEEMKAIEPELARLKESARFAGGHGADWWSVLMAVNEALSKAVGRGTVDERLQNAASYEIARSAIFVAWSKGSKAEPMPAPEPPPFHDGVQTTMFDVTDAYT